MTEKHQLKQLEDELYMAEKNKKMFYRLWLKWSNEHMDIERAIERRIEQEIKENVPEEAKE